MRQEAPDRPEEGRPGARGPRSCRGPSSGRRKSEHASSPRRHRHLRGGRGPGGGRAARRRGGGPRGDPGTEALRGRDHAGAAARGVGLPPLPHRGRGIRDDQRPREDRRRRGRRPADDRGDRGLDERLFFLDRRPDDLGAQGHAARISSRYPPSGHAGAGGGPATSDACGLRRPVQQAGLERRLGPVAQAARRSPLPHGSVAVRRGGVAGAGEGRGDRQGRSLGGRDARRSARSLGAFDDDCRGLFSCLRGRAPAVPLPRHECGGLGAGAGSTRRTGGGGNSRVSRSVRAFAASLPSGGGCAGPV